MHNLELHQTGLRRLHGQRGDWPWPPWIWCFSAHARQLSTSAAPPTDRVAAAFRILMSDKNVKAKRSISSGDRPLRPRRLRIVQAMSQVCMPVVCLQGTNAAPATSQLIFPMVADGLGESPNASPKPLRGVAVH